MANPESDQVFQTSPANPVPLSNVTAMVGTHKDVVAETRSARIAATPPRVDCGAPFRTSK